LRVGLLICGDLHYPSGGFLYDRMLAEHLRARGDEVEIFRQPWGGWRSLAGNFDSSFLKSLFNSRLDLLLQDELAHPSLFLLNRKIRRAALFPVISIVHHLRSGETLSPWTKPAAAFAERLYLRSVDGFVFNSMATRAAVENISGSAKPAVIARPGADRFGKTLSPREITDRCANGKSLEILFVGSVIPRKGLHVLISALRELRGETWNLTVAGDNSLSPSYTSSLMRLINRLGIDPQVRFTGRIDDSRLAGLFADSHLLVVPSELEGYGIVYGEAGAFGVPAIATDCGAPAELISHGVNGFLIKPGDYPGLTACIQSLLWDRERLLSLSLAARRRFDSLPGWNESMAVAAGFLTGQALSYAASRR